MHAKHEGSRWVVRGKRKHVFGKHRRKGDALSQEGAIHMHIRQGSGGKTILSIFGPAKKKRRKKKGKR